VTDSLSSFAGLVSFDYRSLVDAIIAADHKPADAAQSQIDAATKSQTALGNFRDLLTTLRTSLAALRDGTAFGKLTAGVTGTGTGGRSLYSAAATTGAQAGSYQIEVVSLARAQKLSSTTVADASAAQGLAGTFSLNGAPVVIAATDTLYDIRDRINAANSGTPPAQVSASILTVGPGDSRLVLTSQVAGSAGIAHSDTGGGVLAALGLTGGNEVLVDGSEAKVKVDDILVTRASNVIADAIPGVTLTLQAAEEGTTTTLDLTQDSASAVAAMKALVDGYNAVGSFLQAQRTAGTTNPPLYNDSVLRSTRAALSRGLLGLIGGDDGNATTGSLAGLSLAKTGQLTLDETKFTAALGGSLPQLQSLFADGTGSADLETSLGGLLETNTGTVDLKNVALTERVSRLQDRIASIESRLDHKRAALLAQFAHMEATIGTLQSQGSYLSTQSTLFSNQSTR
jgi:flagellar hook-associated protein 2